MPGYDFLIDELERALAVGGSRHRLKALQRITDLFVAGSGSYAEEHIALFDDLLLRLSADIEEKARAKLSQRLAGMGDAPPKLIRSLAFDDAIAVAAPVLTASPQLTDADLVENASTKSQDHLYAITQRLNLSEAVTDVLVARGDRRVVRSVARNISARFSPLGFERLVAHARSDRRIALTVGRRNDIPRQYFLKLLESASASVRSKLLEHNPQAAAAIDGAVDEVAGAMRRETRESSRQYVEAVKESNRRFRAQPVTEAHVHAPARAQEFDRTVVALAKLSNIPVDIIERALLDQGADMVLIVAKAAGCTWATAKALLTMHAAQRPLSELDLQKACASYERLQPATAARVLKFHERRVKLRESSTAMIGAAAQQGAGA